MDHTDASRINRKIRDLDPPMFVELVFDLLTSVIVDVDVDLQGLQPEYDVQERKIVCFVEDLAHQPIPEANFCAYKLQENKRKSYHRFDGPGKQQIPVGSDEYIAVLLHRDRKQY